MNRKNSMRMVTVGLEHWQGQFLLVILFLNCLHCCAALLHKDFVHSPEITVSGVQREGIYEEDLGVSWQSRSDLDVSGSDTNGTMDEQLLLEFLKGVSKDPSNVLSNWNSNSHTNYCNWTGVQCNNLTGRVIALNLTGLQLQGYISARLGDLQFLESLDLSNNSFQGSIPSSIGNCSYLTTLDLSRNMVSGSIPSELTTLSNLQVLSLSYNALMDALPPSLLNLSALRVLSMDSNQLSGDIRLVDWGQFGQLQVLNLSENYFSGAIPESLSNCSNLVELDLGYNNFDGQIPDTFGNLQKLRFLRLTSNALTGSIPPSYGNLANLEVLALANNTLQGSIPVSLLNCSLMYNLILEQNNLTSEIPANIGVLVHLRFLYLRENSLTGRIPPSLANCTDLQELVLDQNLLTGNLRYLGLDTNSLQGSIPVSLVNCSGLRVLDFSINQLHGDIPTDIGKLYQLEFIAMWANSLTGGIPTSLLNCTSLLHIAINSNRLGGEIPAEIGLLHQLQYLVLWDNELVGDIPASLVNCTSLTTIDMTSNFFSGEIPPIGTLTELDNLALAMNSIRGGIPPSLGNCSQLRSLLIENNYLSGEIPPELGQLTHLQALNLSDNYLVGSIPPELFNCPQLYELDLSGNSLSGIIPTELGTVGTLRLLHLNNNNLTGSISPTMSQNLTNLLDINVAHNSLSGDISAFDLAVLKNLMISLDLSHNQFTGPLPPSIGELQFVQMISLSFNAFSGAIPGAFGECGGLTWLDLSSNKLGGEIPQTLKSLHLTYFNVSNNQLNGSIPTFFDNFTDGSFLGNPNLCGPMLPNNCDSRCRGIHCYLLWIILVPSVVVGIAALALAGLWFLYFAKRRKGSKGMVWALFSSDFTSEIEDLSFENIVAATQGFSDCSIVGVGPKSTVFAGVLPSGVMVAVKRLDFDGHERDMGKFSSELQKLARLEHPNLLKIHGLFRSEDLTVLVMDYMPIGSLHKQLYDGDQCRLTWAQRLNIAIGVAEAMVHLHHTSSELVIHQDLKPSNIFLDAKLEPKVGDYGMTKFVNHESHDGKGVSSNFYGTVGYIPPEYGALTNVSTMGDVYNFGLVLIELFTRKQPNDEMFGQELSYRSWFADAFPSRISEILDPTLRQEFACNEQDVGIHLIFRLAMACTRTAPKERPSMTEALDMLCSIRSTSLLYS